MTCRLEIMMACHYSSIVEAYARRDHEHRFSPAVTQIQARWLSLGYLRVADEHDQREYGADYTGTEALKVYTEALMKVPMPRRVERWEVPTSWENT